ncbi:hypothetical protein HC031_15375 [Planosporangium thailandense]|uniref:Uncharacterized protein n=1 Tax=Planosporangium thailandense TaxID=765197 RepID=A0ABX0Y0T6_9ACTN|nr:hypothetical protein [Planosporangium thailandense]NJC71082.1 hypothetical protein [Planosporangium thailandense]
MSRYTLVVAGACCLVAGSLLPMGVAAAGGYSGGFADSVTLRGNTVTAQAWSSLREPPEICEGRRYPTVITGTKHAETLTGGPENDLIVGLGAATVLRGGAGDDCIVAGPGVERIDGGPGHDVCVVSAATTAVTGCEVTLRLYARHVAGLAPAPQPAPAPVARSVVGSTPVPAPSGGAPSNAPSAVPPAASSTAPVPPPGPAATQSTAPVAQPSDPPAATGALPNEQNGPTP